MVEYGKMVQDNWGYINNLNTKQRYDLAGKYYQKALDLEYYQALTPYIKILKDQNKFDEILEIYFKLKNREYLVEFLNNITDCYNYEKILNLILELSDTDLKFANYQTKIIHKLLKSKINLLELNFKYRPDGAGFLEAKQDFLTKLKILK